MAADKRLDKLVSYSTTGEAISKSFSEINKTAGIALSVADPFDEDILAMRIENIPVRDFMTRLATVTKLSWKPTENGYALYQTEERKKEAERELYNERIGGLKALRAEQLAQFRLPRPDFDEAERRLSAESENPPPDPNEDIKLYLERARLMEQLRNDADPSRWLVAAVIAHLTDSQLTRLLDDGALSLSNNPNRMQIALPKQAEKDLAAWANRFGVLDYNAQVTIRMRDGRELVAEVTIYQDAQRLGSQAHFLAIKQGLLPPNSTDSKNTALDKDIEIDGLLGESWRRQSSRKHSDPALASLIKAMANPAEHEFLRAAAGEGLIELSRKTGSQLIAFLHDEMMELGGPGDLPTNGRKKLAQFCDEVRATYTEIDGWLTVAPVELSLARAKRFPRKHFRAMQFEGGGRLSLQELARIVYECSDEQLDTLFVHDCFGRALNQTEEFAIASWGENSSLRLWHSLKGAELERLLTNGTIRIGSLDPESKKILWRTCALGRGGFNSGKLVFSETFRNPQGSDPARVYPNGFPADELLEAQVGSQPIVLAKFTGGGPVPMFLSLNIERFEDMSRQNPVDFDNVRVGLASLVRLSVDRVVWSATYRSEAYDFAAAPIPWSKAPAPLREEFDTLRKLRGGGQP